MHIPHRRKLLFVNISMQKNTPGGKSLFEHQTIKYNLFKVFMKIKAARALSRGLVASEGFLFQRGMSLFGLFEDGFGLKQIVKSVSKIDIYLVGRPP